MTNLKDFIIESLLDDEDILDKNIDKNIASTLLKKLDQKFEEYNFNNSFSRFAGRNRKTSFKNYDSVIEGDTLIFKHYNNLDIYGGIIDIFNEIHDLNKFNSIKDINVSPNNTSGSSIIIRYRKLPSYIKNIYTENSLLGFDNCDEIKNLNLYLKPGPLNSAFRAGGLRNETMSNVYIEINSESQDSSLSHIIVFDYIPKFSNVSGKNVQEIRILDNLLLYHDDALKRIDNVFDQSFKARYFDTKKNEYVFRKTNIKTIRANLVNYKRYVFEDESGCNFKIDPKFKLKNFLDISKFDNSLSCIKINDDVIGIVFSKDKNYYDHIREYINLSKIKFMQQLPNDPGWYLYIYKRN